MAYYQDIPDDIKKLFPGVVEFDVNFTNNRYSLGCAFDWQETPQGWEFWNLVDRKLFDQARSLLKNSPKIKLKW